MLDNGLLIGDVSSEHLVQPTWTGLGTPSLLIYDGQVTIVGLRDRYIYYRWSAFSAIETMLKDEALLILADVRWLYYNGIVRKFKSFPSSRCHREYNNLSTG